MDAYARLYNVPIIVVRFLVVYIGLADANLLPFAVQTQIPLVPFVGDVGMPFGDGMPYRQTYLCE